MELRHATFKLFKNNILTAITSSKGYLYTRRGDWYFCTMIEGNVARYVEQLLSHFCYRLETIAGRSEQLVWQESTPKPQILRKSPMHFASCYPRSRRDFVTITKNGGPCVRLSIRIVRLSSLSWLFRIAIAVQLACDKARRASLPT